MYVCRPYFRKKDHVVTDTYAYPRLLELPLDDANFQNTIPTEIGVLSTLTDLTLSRNKLHGTIPSEIGALTALTTLRLRKWIGASNFTFYYHRYQEKKHTTLSLIHPRPAFDQKYNTVAQLV